MATGTGTAIWLGKGMLTPPMDHQIRALSWSLDRPNGMLWMDIGTGKTLVALYLLRLRGIRRTLVVCPNSVRHVWEEESRKHCGAPVTILDGSAADRRRALAAPEGIFVLNYEGLKVLGGRKMRLTTEDGTELSKYTAGPLDDRMRFDAVIFDEAHHLKNWRAVQTKVAYALARQAKLVLLLTGTPVSKDERDLWSQAFIMDGGASLGRSFYQFLAKYFRKTMYDWLPKTGSREEILRKMHDGVFRVSREECFDLPPKAYETRLVSATAEQVKVMTELTDRLRADVAGGTVTAANVLVAVQKIAQVAGGFLLRSDGSYAYKFEPNPKLIALNDLLDEIGGLPTVIYHTFQEEGRMISEMLERRDAKVSKARGDLGAEANTDSIRKFREGKTDVLVASHWCGGEGLNLQRAAVAVFYSNSYEGATTRVQSEGRLWRYGRDGPCLFVDIVMEHSVDQCILDACRRKRKIADAVLEYFGTKER